MRRLLITLLFPLCCLGQSLKSNVDQFIEKKQFIKAKDTLQTLLKVKPNDLEAIELLGDVYSNQKDWDQAIEQYEKLVELNSNEANYHYKYGGALGMKALSVNKLRALPYLGDMEEAFLKAAELDPTHIENLWALTRYYMHVPAIIGGSKQKAWKYTDELMAISPVDGYLAKGHFYEDDEDFEKAEIYYEKAIQIGGSYNCYKHLYDLYLVFENPQKALKTMENYYSSKGDERALQLIKQVCTEYNLTSSILKN